MKLSNIEFERPYVLDKHINYFIIENKLKYFEYCKSLIDQTNNLECCFILSEKDKELSFNNNVFIINDFLNINFTDRKITNKLHQATNVLINSNYVKEFNELIETVVNFINTISIDNDFETDFNDVLDVSTVLKAIDYKLVNTSESLIETILNYLTIIISFFNPKLIIFYNLRVWLSDEECLELYKYIKYNDLKILLLESSQYNKLDEENFYIIDNDLCELTF